LTEVRLESVVVRLPGFTFGPISLAIAGGLTSIVGPSGAGKSTLLSLVAAIRPATEGAVFIDGVDAARLPDRRRAGLRRCAIAFTSQQPLFLADRDLRANLVLAARLRQGGEARIDPLLERLGLKGKESRLPAELSGGELARANTARVLIGPARLVCLDEPTAMLDEESADLVRDLLVEESRTRRLLVATHDEALVEASTSVIRLLAGRVAGDP
jgi:putative ABC transport system ATP-binding protein